MLKTLNILILEDSLSVVDLITTELKNSGLNFEYKVVDNRADYITALDKYNPDIILSKYTLPGFNSIEALKVFKEKEQSIPFILVTSTVNKEFVANVIKSGADDYILITNLVRLPYAINKFLKEKQQEIESKQTKTDLITSEEKYRGLIEQANDAIFLANEKFQFILTNLQASKMLGYTEEEFKSLSIPEITYIGKTDEPLMVAERSHLLANIHERMMIHKDGSLVSVEINGKKLENGFYLAFARDISDRIKAEEEIKESEAKYRILIERVSDAFVSLDKDWNYTYVNKKAGDIFGREPESLIGKHIWTEFPEGVGQPFYKAYYKAMETQTHQFLEEYFPHFNKWFENHIYPSPDGLTIYFNDVTENKLAVKALKESEEMHRLILNAAMDAIIFINASSEITLWNPQAEKIFGWTAKEITGKKLMQTIIPSRYADKHIEGMKKYLETGVGPILNKAIEITALNNKGEEFPIELSIVPINIEESRFFCAFIRDITKRKLDEQKLREGNEITKGIINNSNSVIYLFNTRGEFIMANKKFEEVTGVSSDTFIGKTREGFFSKEISDQHRQNDLQVINTKQALYFEEGNLEADGMHFYITAKFPLFATDDQVYAVGGISTDITESKKAEQELKKINVSLQHAEKLVGLGNWEVDLATGKISWSKQMFKHFGLDDSSEPFGFDNLDLMHPEDHEKIRSVNISFSKGEIPSIDFVRTNPAYGPVKYLEPTWEIERNEEGLAVKYSGTLLDITSKKETELKIKKLNEELEQRVKERTAELLKANKDLEDVNNVFVGNQIEIIELKKDIKELKKKLLD